MRVLFDTCVILDALQGRQAWKKEAEELFLAVANREIDGYVTAKECTDIYYMMRKYLSSEKQAISVLQAFCELFQILDTAKEDIQKALFTDASDFEDAVMIEAAKRENVDCICTRNIKDYQASYARVFLPKDLLSVLHPSEGENR